MVVREIGKGKMRLACADVLLIRYKDTPVGM